MKTKIVRFIFALMLVLSVLGISASAALADAPTQSEYTLTIPASFSNVCSFQVNVVSVYQVTETDFYDKSGALIRLHNYFVAQDTFTANGKTLVGIPFTANTEMLFDSSGNMIHYYVQGVSEKIPLPDGSLFISVGRSDGINHPGEAFLLSPDKGNQGNIAGFCAALAP